MQMALLVDALWTQGLEPSRLRLPYVPGARQDRQNFSGGDVLYTIKTVAKLINSCQFERVEILDPHSIATTALIDHCTPTTIPCEAMNYLTPPYGAVVAPDAGAEKRAAAMVAHLNRDLLKGQHALQEREVHPPMLLQGWKRRDATNGRLSGFGIQPPGDPAPSGPILMMDDICDGGGTFLGLAAAMREAGYQNPLHLYVTHGLFSKGTAELLEVFEAIHCTDSILCERPGVTVIPLFPTQGPT